MTTLLRTLAALIILLCASEALALHAPAPTEHETSRLAPQGLPPSDLEELLAPIALYPDPLLANVLTAACYPDELQQAKSGQGKAEDWEPSVQAVAKIPDALKMLTDYPEWTKALGEAFIVQSKDVMAAVQRLRARAYANGALHTTEQQIVVPQNDTIIIQPAEPEVIYVPSYQPSVVYVNDDDDDEWAAGAIGFGLGITAGLIIANNVDCDWWGGGCCWGCGWGHGDVDIDINRGDINIDNSRVNNIKNNGNQWKPNQNKLGADIKAGNATSLNNYRGVASGRAKSANIPNRAANAKPIAAKSAPRPSNVTRQRQQAANRPAAQPMTRPDSMNRPQTPQARPSIPPASQRPPAARSGSDWGVGSRPATPSQQRPSAYSGGGGTQRAASRGSSSRGSAGGGRSRGGGGRRR